MLFYQKISFLFLITIIASCSITKDLQQDELLITNAKIKYENPEHIRKEKKFKSELEAVIQPQPTSGKINLSTKIYQWGEKSKKKKGLKKWLQKNFGKAPAIYNERTQNQNRLRMKKLLKDNGFFRSDIEVDTTISGKKIKMTYRILTQGQYKINRIFLPSDTTVIGRLVKKNQEKSVLKEGDFYSEILLAEERNRISNIATQNGYLDFSANYIYYHVDTIVGTFTTDIYMSIKLPSNRKDHTKYRLGKTNIFPNYNLSNNTSTKKLDTIRYAEDVSIIENYHLLDHKVLDRMILQNEGQVIQKKYQDASVNHLLDLGIFKFVNLKYEMVGDTFNPVLNRNIFLTPNFNQNVSANFELNNRTGGFYGIGASANYRHLNLFKKAITFNANVAGGVETQIGNDLSFLNTIDLNAELSLATPRFILPFKIRPNSGLFVPRSSLTVGNNFQRRISLFSINSSNLKMGYQWKETAEKQHKLYPISFNRVQVLNKTMRFDSLLNEQPRLAQSFQNLLIAGLDYTYIFTNQNADAKKDFWFFRGNIRTSGNLGQLAAQAFGLEKNNDGKYEISQLPFAQFVSLESDIRFYKRLNNNTFAFRFSPAVGFAYGNSEVLPYIEQFFVGGANSIRAFRIRGIGPGSFARQNITEDDISQQFIDQTGDVKLEMSAEYRFGILGYFKGAAFVDAGNVWLLNNADDQNNEFKFNRFGSQIAIGAGLGLRLDIDYIVLRLDVATPLRKPFYGEDFRWTFDRMEFKNRDWRKENVIFSLAIGYPF